MNDLLSIAIFAGCVLATLGLVRVCEWLRPKDQSQRPDDAGGRGRLVQHTEDGP